uniref:Uncharacterized protein n=1 Tax=Panagrolaimus sp. ES5 TaxID=591445 RepID=A0AC34EZ59_9BILA
MANRVCPFCKQLVLPLHFCLRYTFNPTPEEIAEVIRFTDARLDHWIETGQFPDPNETYVISGNFENSAEPASSSKKKAVRPKYILVLRPPTAFEGLSDEDNIGLAMGNFFQVFELS